LTNIARTNIFKESDKTTSVIRWWSWMCTVQYRRFQWYSFYSMQTGGTKKTIRSM